MRDRTIAWHAVAAVAGVLAVGALAAMGLAWRIDAAWLQVLVVAGMTAAGTAHGASVVHVVFRLADPPSLAARLDSPGSQPRSKPDLAPPQGTMRGGSMIGVLERASSILAIAVAEPTILAAIVAIKAVGRFGELSGDGLGAAARMRERFLVGSLASLTVAGVWGVAASLLVR